MKSYGKLAALMISLWLIMWGCANAAIISKGKNHSKQYLVDAERITLELEEGRTPSADNYPAVTGIFPDDGSGLFDSSNERPKLSLNGK